MSTHRKQGTTHNPNATPKLAEDWSPRRFYKTMLFLFRERPDSNPKEPKPLPHPFYLNRPLTEKAWQACARSYADSQVRRLLFAKSQEARMRPLSQRKTKPEKKKVDPGIELGWELFHKLGCWDLPGLPVKDHWKYIPPLGQFLFASSKEAHQVARRKLKALAKTAKPIKLRSVLSQVARTPIQIKNCFPLARQFRKTMEGAMIEIPSIEGMIRYLAERQFLWAFLAKEAGSPKKAVRAERQSNADFYSKILAKEYPFLGLDAEAISKGLMTLRQAEKDAAVKFGCSIQTIRSLISKSTKF